MVRHLVRHVVRVGEHKQFVAAAQAFNDAAAACGIPRYRFYSALFGDLNEVWGEADYESVEAHLQAFRTAPDELRQALRTMLSHAVEGAQHDYILEEEQLG